MRLADSPLGILQLDTGFPRIKGDIGNPDSFAFPVRYHVVQGATTDKVVTGADQARTLLPAFIKGARALEAAGASAITTSCGFLSVVQPELAASVSVPVMTSSLFLVPMVRQMVAGRPIGIVTAHSGHLSAHHLTACGIDPGWEVHVSGLENAPCFSGAILSGDTARFDPATICGEVVAVCKDLITQTPDLAAFVFECTNLPPYAAAVQDATGQPVFNILHLAQLLRGVPLAPG